MDDSGFQCALKQDLERTASPLCGAIWTSGHEDPAGYHVTMQGFRDAMSPAITPPNLLNSEQWIPLVVNNRNSPRFTISFMRYPSNHRVPLPVLAQLRPHIYVQNRNVPKGGLRMVSGLDRKSVIVEEITQYNL